jgi:hypothetical protein
MNRTVVLLLVALAASEPAWPQGDPIGPPFHVNTYTPGSQDAASVARDPDGDFVVVWQSSPPGPFDPDIMGQRFDGSGAPVGPEFRVNTSVTGLEYTSSVVADAAGNFVVVWESYPDGFGRGTFGQRFASSGAPLGPQFRVNSYTSYAQAYPVVGADSAGNFVVAWTSVNQDGSQAGVFGQRFDSSGSPMGPEFRVNSATLGSQAGPAVAVAPAGDFVVVWTDGTLPGLQGQRYSSSGAQLGSEFTVAPGVLNQASVATDGLGNFVVVWVDGSGVPEPGPGVYGQRFSASGAPLGSSFRVNTFTAGFEWFPSVAVDSSGDFVVAWMGGHDGQANGVFGQRFDGSGSPSGPEFRVNTFTTNSQGFPAVACDSAGSFVVVWQSDFEEGVNYGIFGQRFGRIVPVELTRFTVE